MFTVTVAVTDSNSAKLGVHLLFNITAESPLEAAFFTIVDLGLYDEFLSEWETRLRNSGYTGKITRAMCVEQAKDHMMIGVFEPAVWFDTPPPNLLE